MTNKVAVYGTLKRNQPNHDTLGETAVFKGNLFISGYKMYSLGAFPAILPTVDKNSTVFCEVYEVDESVIGALDFLEGYDQLNINSSLYTRELYHSHVYGNVWVYVLNKPELIIDNTPLTNWK